MAVRCAQKSYLPTHRRDIARTRHYQSIKINTSVWYAFPTLQAVKAAAPEPANVNVPSAPALLLEFLSKLKTIQFPLPVTEGVASKRILPVDCM